MDASFVKQDKDLTKRIRKALREKAFLGEPRPHSKTPVVDIEPHRCAKLYRLSDEQSYPPPHALLALLHISILLRFTHHTQSVSSNTQHHHKEINAGLLLWKKLKV